MQQLKASIANDLVRGQGDNSATRDLLKQYVPLDGIVSKPEPDIPPVENCMAPRATVARNDISACHGATVAPHATLASHATLVPRASLAPHATVARGATNKDDDDIKTKNKSSSSKGEETEIADNPLENHTCAAAPREKETAELNFILVREAYEKATGNRWNQSDSEAYQQNKIGDLPATKIISVLDAVVRRTPTKINSFKYFVKEIIAQPDPRNRAWQKKRLEKIVHKIRDISVGRSGYSMADFVEDVKCSCAREGIAFDNDAFNELVG
jgi:hypothetical protein